MSQWKMDDSAANSVSWAVAQFKKTPNTSNRDAFYGNTTANAFVAGATVGQFAADSNEVAANPAIPHSGWVIRTEGTGGRAGRVHYEVLVAGRITSDGSDDTVLPDYKLRITTQPLSNTANTSAAENATFRVVAASTPAGATLTYAWTYANGTTLASGANVGTTTSANLVVNSAVVTTNTSFKVTVGATGAANVVSSNATLTITT